MSQLAATIERLGFTRDQTAKLLGVERSTLQRWLTESVPIPGPVERLLYLIDEGRSRELVDKLASFNPFAIASTKPARPRKTRAVKQSKGAALSAAERQKRYRDKKGQEEEKKLVAAKAAATPTAPVRHGRRF